ncbi:MAG TPA: hypothetical protein VFW52_03470 [Candidatus Saccharimonadales bacterium]|nr:hypothetical protein [Candidatus Saccharimonadales bacterium]
MGNGETPLYGEQSEPTDIKSALRSFVAEGTPIDPLLQEHLLDSDAKELMRDLIPSVQNAPDTAAAASRYAIILKALFKKEALLERSTQTRPSDYTA